MVVRPESIPLARAVAMKGSEDAYGQAMFARFEGRDAYEVIERDDGYFDCSMGPPAYFAAFDDWPSSERQAIRQARGRVLDVGCGAGRVTLYLQKKGHEVVGIDISPLAVKVSRLRGVRDARAMPVTRVSSQLGKFDTIVMFGNNFGLLEGEVRGRWLLRRFRSITKPGARILATSRTPGGSNPQHRRYVARNPQRGRLPGQLRIRVRYMTYATPWFDYLLASPRQMRTLLRGTGWSLDRVHGDAEDVYTAVIRRRDE
jgi:SAM-dependent methyltransferase